MSSSEDTGKRAAGYIRVSQERAAKNGYGLGAQETDLRKYAGYKGLELVEIYSENGQSGYERERPALERLLKDAKAGNFDVVIFPSIDRAARSVKDMIEIDTHLRKHDVDIVFLREGIDTSTPIGELFRNIMASIAQFEGRLIYERLFKGKRRKAAEGGYVGGWLPYGYKKDGDAVVVVEDEATVVEQIFQWKAEGRTLHWICDTLNDDGIETKRNGKWQVSTIRGMLKNRFYTGRVELEGSYIRGQHDAIVSDMLFRKCCGDLYGSGAAGRGDRQDGGKGLDS